MEYYVSGACRYASEKLIKNTRVRLIRYFGHERSATIERVDQISFDAFAGADLESLECQAWETMSKTARFPWTGMITDQDGKKIKLDLNLPSAMPGCENLKEIVINAKSACKVSIMYKELLNLFPSIRKIVVKMRDTPDTDTVVEVHQRDRGLWTGKWDSAGLAEGGSFAPPLTVTGNFKSAFTDYFAEPNTFMYGPLCNPARVWPAHILMWTYAEKKDKLPDEFKKRCQKRFATSETFYRGIRFSQMKTGEAMAMLLNDRDIVWTEKMLNRLNGLCDDGDIEVKSLIIKRHEELCTEEYLAQKDKREMNRLMHPTSIDAVKEDWKIKSVAGGYAIEDRKTSFSSNVMIPSIIGRSPVVHVGRIFNPRSMNPKDMTVEMPDSVKTISDGVFQNMTMKKVVLPAGLTIIPSCLFQSSNIDEIVVGDKIEIINRSAFCGAKVNTPITVPNCVRYIGEFAFEGANVREIDLDICVIQKGAFSRSTLERVRINAPIIMEGAFEDADCLKEVHIEAAKWVDRHAFSRVHAPHVYVSALLTRISPYAFMGAVNPTFHIAAEDDNDWKRVKALLEGQKETVNPTFVRETTNGLV